MKLQLKHIAGYLPYDLKAKFQETQNPKCRTYVIGTIGSMYVEKNGGVSIACYDTVNAVPLSFKPILRPISDLIKIPSIESLDAWLWFPEFVERFSENPTHERLRQAPYPIIELCFKNHIDIYDLIGQGLAIDINKLKEL